jgi:hypothetical protein
MKSLMLFAASFLLFGLGALLLQSSGRIAIGIFLLACLVFFVGLFVNHGEHTRRR